jgi:phospholipid/cholesterol/gamma-HCH transport system permease protein
LTLHLRDCYNRRGKGAHHFRAEGGLLLAVEVPVVLKFIKALGRRVLAFLSFFGELSLLLLHTLGGMLRRPAERRQTVSQMAQIGIDSLPIVGITMLFSGMVLAYHTGQQAGKLGVGALIGWLVAESVTRELGPVLTAVVVAARVGSAMTAELGTMKVTEQIDALRALATDPVEYLVVPRFLAGLVMVPILALLGDVIGVAGGYLVALGNSNINPVAYWANIPGNLENWTIIGGIIKTFFFAIIICIVGCHQGLTCKMDSEEVGRAVTRSVVYCIMLVYGANLVLTTIIFPN